MTKKSQPASTVRNAPLARYALYGLLIAAALGIRYWFTGPKIPMPDLSGATAELETAVNAAAAKIDEAPNSANAWGNFGMLLAAHQFTAEAIDSYDKAHGLAPTDWRWPYLKAVALEHIDPVQSIAALEVSAQLGRPDDDLPALQLAATLIDSGQPSEAERVLRSMTDGGGLPRNPRAQLLLTRALVQQGKFDQSLEILSPLAKHEQTQHAAHQLLSHVHSRLGNHTAAADARRIADSLPPDRPLENSLREKLARMHTSKEVYIAQVNQLRQLGRLEQLEQVGQEGFARFPELGYFSQGKTALIDGNPTAAEPAFRQALAIDPRWIDALIGLGESLVEQDKLAEAEQVFRKAVEIEPSNGSAYLRLGRCLLKQGKPDAAVEALQNAVEYLPLSPDAHTELAGALAKIGRDDEANEHRRHARRLNTRTNQAPPKNRDN